MKQVFTLLVVASLLLLSARPAPAASDEAKRIRELENRIQEIQKTYLQNNQRVASTISRSEGVQQDFATLKGQVKGNTHLLQKQSDELMRVITELDHRIQSIEERLEMFSAQLTKALGKVAPAAASEIALYQKGLDLVNQSKYLEAAATFQRFRNKYPKSQHAGSAQLWIAECFYGVRDYRRAIKEYQTFIEGNRRSPKIGDALLKQGNSFYELGMAEESKAFYEKAIKEYPSSAAADQAKVRLERIKDREATAAGATGGLTSYPTETIQQRQGRMNGASKKKSEEKTDADSTYIPDREF